VRTRALHVVGRDRELELLKLGLAEAGKARGGAFFLIGEPGIGKTRLAMETAGQAFSGGLTVLRGRGSSIGPTVPFRPLAEAFMSQARSGMSALRTELGAYRQVLSRLIPDWSEEGLPPVDTSLLVLAEAVLRLLAVLGRDRGCLLIVEDLHEADAETLAVVEYLVDNLDEVPAMLLATSRNEPGSALTLAQATAQRDTARLIELSPLDAPQMRDLAASCLEINPDRVPEPLVAALWKTSGGNPLMVEEMLHSMVNNGQLAADPRGWRIVGEIRPEVPATLVRSIGERSDRLGSDGRRLLSVAAVLGHRFPLSVVQRVTGMADHNLLSHLRAGVAAQLIMSDEPVPDWYAFQHPVTGEALLSLLTPIERAELSRRAADAVEEIHPELPGEWCQLVAALRAEAGDKADAAQRFTEAGRRALADGATESAVVLLERAQKLVSRRDNGSAHADSLELLLFAYAESGRFDRTFQLADQLGDLAGTSLSANRRARLHIRIAWVCAMVGRWADGVAQLNTASILLGPEPSDADAAALDSVAADLAMDAPGPDRMLEAERLARQALAAAERSNLPAIAAQAWLTIAVVTRRRDLEECNLYLHRALALAEEHRQPSLRINALYLLGANKWLVDGSTGGLELARQDALRAGAVTITCTVDGSLAVDKVLRGEFDAAAASLDRQLQTAKRLQMVGISRYLLFAAGTLAAHQGRRRELEQALAEFEAVGGMESRELPLMLGLAQAFGALLEEDADRATEILDTMVASEQAHPTPFSLAGRHGLRPLLRVLRGEADRAELDEVFGGTAAGMRWNRQFVLLADAVLHGREGHGAEAMASFAEAQRLAAVYPMVRNLGLRLIAESAYLDGWGDPQTWLSTAEDYFHTAGIPAVASGCRALLRRVGGPVRQWRTDTDRVPQRFRRQGVTIREFEVLELLVLRLSNKAIAGRLHISPRTVEKHVASLMTKFGLANRQELITYAATLPG
jgi:DNA-binding CsgD family transcriptional regulator